jgi:hypothetical protein
MSGQCTPYPHECDKCHGSRAPQRRLNAVERIFRRFIGKAGVSSAWPTIFSITATRFSQSCASKPSPEGEHVPAGVGNGSEANSSTPLQPVVSGGLGGGKKPPVNPPLARPKV